eukprot:m51a1_g9646 hypothetical protein (221) ;mRNA; r:1170676-1171460
MEPITKSATLMPEERDRLLRRTLQLELSAGTVKRPSGVYLAPSAGSVLEWHAVIFARQAPLYRGGVFRLVVSLPSAYPLCLARCPLAARFASRVWHPLVDPATGALSLPPPAACARLLDVVAHAKDVLYAARTPRACAVLNPEAARALEGDRAAFAEHARACVEESLRDAERDPPGWALPLRCCSAASAAAKKALGDAIRESGGRSMEEVAQALVAIASQ